MRNSILVELKKIVLLAFVLVLLSTAVIVGFVRPAVAQETIYIRADGSVEGTTDISTVDNVTYTFTGNIFNQSIIVERDDIVVDGASYTLQGTGSRTGIDMTGRSNVTIKNMKVKAFEYGIRIYHSSNNTISGNNITNNDLGIRLNSSNYNRIYKNKIKSHFLDGIKLEGSNNRVYRNTVTYSYRRGITLGHSSNNSIYGNSIVNNNDWGIGLYYLNNNNIYENNIMNNDKGIYIAGSSDTLVYGNNITNNDYYGIDLEHDSSNNIIQGNNITNHLAGAGVWLQYSSNNRVRGNSLTENGCGIWIGFSSNETIFENTITNNRWGIAFYNSSDNIVYPNNFVNTNQVSIDPYYSANFWDDGYPSGGDYWSDYTDIDQYSGPNQDQPGSDGIWDHPYIINDYNQDNYPIVPEFPTWTSILLILTGLQLP